MDHLGRRGCVGVLALVDFAHLSSRYNFWPGGSHIQASPILPWNGPHIQPQLVRRAV
jgi:hypothetical protein